MALAVRRIDANGDWTFGRGRGDYASGSESIQQRVVTRLRSFTNDWFLNLSYGINWTQDSQKPADLAGLEAEVKATLLQTDGVKAIKSFAMDLNEFRVLTVTATLVDEYNTTYEVSL